MKTAEEAAKMIRSIKKKLSHIDELESKRRFESIHLKIFLSLFVSCIFANVQYPAYMIDKTETTR